MADTQFDVTIPKENPQPPQEESKPEIIRIKLSKEMLQCSEEESKPEVIQTQLTNELEILDQMLGKNSEMRDLISQVIKVMILLYRLCSRQDKTFSLDKEIELTFEVQKIKDSYNTWDVLIITCISGGLSIIGGLIGISGGLVGTGAGNALGKLPGLKAFFNVSGAADKSAKITELTGKISGISNGIGGIATGAGSLGKLFDNKNEAKRAVHQFTAQQLQKLHSDKSQSAQEARQQTNEAVRTAKQNDKEYHEATRAQ